MAEETHVYARYYGAWGAREDGLPAAVVAAKVNVFTRAGAKPWGDWAAYVGAVPAEAVPDEWDAGIAPAGDPDPHLGRVLGRGTKLPQAAAEAIFPWITTRHPVKWRP
jgi:hypothetical protein